MIKLIKLEWKKNNIAKYMRGAVILAAFLCLFVFALAFWGLQTIRTVRRMQQREWVQSLRRLNCLQVCPS